MSERSRPTPFSTASFQAIKALQGTPEEISGGVIVYNLYALLRAAVGVGNEPGLLDDQSDRFISVLVPQFVALGSREIVVTLKGTNVYVNRVPVRADAAEFARSKWLVQHLVRLGIVEISFRPEISPGEVAAFARRFGEAVVLKGALPEAVGSRNLQVVRSQVVPELEHLLDALAPLSRTPILLLYSEGIARTLEWAREINDGRRPEETLPKRLMGQVIDAFLADPGGVIGTLHMRPLPGTFSNRRFDTAVLSTALALRLGFADTEARELGVVALLRPVAANWGPWWTRGGLAANDAAAVALRSDQPLEVITSFESGAEIGQEIPPSYYGEPLVRHIATQIISAAEAYVDLLQPDSSASPLSPDMAVQTMLASAGVRFDATIVRVLSELLGYYPPGTPCRLNSGDMVVVTDPPPPGTDPRRPAVRPIDPANKTLFELWRPELAGYRIDDVVSRQECPFNPDFLLLL